MINSRFSCILNLILMILASNSEVSAASQANGFKVGEVTTHSATVWTRTTVAPEAIHKVGKFNYVPRKDTPLEILPWQAPGTMAEIKVVYYTKGNQKTAIETPWQQVNENKDFTLKTYLKNLTAATEYKIEVHSRQIGQKPTTAIKYGTFTTAPEKDSTEPIRFTVTTCQGFYRRDKNEGHQIYHTMLQLKPKFLVHTGDVLYYDKPLPFAKNQTLARYKWNRIYALPTLRNFHQNVSCYYQKDDHDVLVDDACPGQTYGDLTFEQGLSIYEEQTPFPEGLPYRTQRWGKDLQIWLMEGRDFRSPNQKEKDPTKRTIWGKQQMQWLEKSLRESDATVKLVISPTPIVGPDRKKGKFDNHANPTYQIEGDKVRALLAQHNAVSICGDRHWQYASFDPKTKLKEFACGPSSDPHAQGYSMKQRQPNHNYLKICGGFLQVEVKRAVEKSSSLKKIVEATFTHHAPDGKINHSQTLKYTTNEKQ